MTCPVEANAVCFIESEPDELAVLLDDRLVLMDLSTMEVNKCNIWNPIYDFNDSDGGFALESRWNLLVHGGLTCISVYDLKKR